MLPNPHKIRIKLKKPENGFPDSSFLGEEDSKTQQLIDISSSSSSDNESHGGSEDENDQSKALVLYDPEANGSGGGAIVPVPDPVEDHQPRRRGIPFQPTRPLPSVGAFTVQCASCFKWRLIPTKEKYEEIREHILEQPFYCETAREWRPDITCDEPADISQDGSRLWAIDKPNIAQPPQGWERLLRIRGEGSSKFADIYYVAPSGKRLRSMVEIQKYLLKHPEYSKDGVKMSQFSFRTPKPLQENYVRKRPPPPRPLAPCNGNRPLEADLGVQNVPPLAWASPDDRTELQLGMPQLPPPSISEAVNRPAKRQATEETLSQELCNSDLKLNTELS